MVNDAQYLYELCIIQLWGKWNYEIWANLNFMLRSESIGLYIKIQLSFKLLLLVEKYVTPIINK